MCARVCCDLLFRQHLAWSGPDGLVVALCETYSVCGLQAAWARSPGAFWVGTRARVGESPYGRRKPALAWAHVVLDATCHACPSVVVSPRPMLRAQRVVSCVCPEAGRSLVHSAVESSVSIV